MRLARQSPRAADEAADTLPRDRLPAFETFGAYRPQGSEINPGPLIQRLVATGAMLALPTAVVRNAPLVFRLTIEGDALVPDAFGIPAPPTSAPAVRPQLIIAPVLAFDRQGGRLGQGAGAFDRTLEALRATGPLFVVGLAYAGQEVDRAAFDAHDQPLDAILTEKGYRVFRKDI